MDNGIHCLSGKIYLFSFPLNLLSSKDFLWVLFLPFEIRDYPDQYSHALVCELMFINPFCLFYVPLKQYWGKNVIRLTLSTNLHKQIIKSHKSLILFSAYKSHEKKPGIFYIKIKYIYIRKFGTSRKTVKKTIKMIHYTIVKIETLTYYIPKSCV